MKHVLSTVGVTGVAVGVRVPTQVTEQPEDPDRMVAWLKQHRQ